MGRIADHGNWREGNEYQFMLILHERARKDPDQNPGLRNADWEEVDNELCAAVGVRYGTERLKGKYYRLRYKFRHFIELLQTRGVTWRAETNTVYASEKIWQTLIKQSKEFRTFRKKGCKYYELLKQIFPDIAAGRPHHLPGNPNENHEIEGDFLNRGLHIGGSEFTGGSSMGGGGPIRGNTRRKAPAVAHDLFSGEHRPTKNPKMERFDEALDAWVAALNNKTTYKANVENHATADCKDRDPLSSPEFYSVERVMDILEGMAGISTTAYMKALDKFTSPDWRKIFIKMSSIRRKEWLKSLE